MSTLEYTISMLEAMPEEKLKEVQNYIRYLAYRDAGYVPIELLNEDAIVAQLTHSIEKSDKGVTTSADVVSQLMREKYVI